jgi:hypothetical protein
LWFATASAGSKADLFHKFGFSLFLLQLFLKRCAIQALKVDGMFLPPLSIFAQVQPDEKKGQSHFINPLGLSE